jgi:hypothetical protein
MNDGETQNSLRHRARILAKEHAEAKERVREYQTRKFLNVGEQLELRALQRIKLMKKDALAAVERELLAHGG